MKKKVLLAMVIMLSLLVFGTLSASAETLGYYTYTVSNGEATITDCDTSISGDITIPANLSGYPVTSIGSNTFYNCTSLTSITIPNSIISIGDNAFSGCTNLTNINVSGNNQYYNSVDGVLFNKDKTTLIQCPDGKTGISYTIPDSVTSIGERAFYACTRLTSVTIPDSVTNIGEHAFSYCDSLTSVTIPDSVTILGDYAFAYCSSITNVTIGDSVTSIGRSAFDRCTSLTSITIGNGVTSIGDYAFYACTGLTSITIGDGVTSIGSGAFYLCKGLTNITIPDSVTSIGDYAFGSCTSLTSVTIGNSVTSIEDYAFNGCTRLKTVYYNGTEEEWDKISISSGNEKLTNATIYYPEMFEISATAKDLAGGEKMIIRDEVTGELKEVDAVLGENDRVVAIFAKNVTGAILEAGKYGIKFNGIKFSGKGNVAPGKSWAISLSDLHILRMDNCPTEAYLQVR